jgi:hypothetical protein
MKDILIQLLLGLVVIAVFLFYHFSQMKKKEKEIQKLKEEIELLEAQRFVLMDHSD